MLLTLLLSDVDNDSLIREVLFRLADFNSDNSVKDLFRDELTDSVNILILLVDLANCVIKVETDTRKVFDGLCIVFLWLVIWELSKDITVVVAVISDLPEKNNLVNFAILEIVRVTETFWNEAVTVNEELATVFVKLMLLEISEDDLLVDGVVSDVNENNLVKFTVVEIVGSTETCWDETCILKM